MAPSEKDMNGNINTKEKEEQSGGSIERGGKPELLFYVSSLVI